MKIQVICLLILVALNCFASEGHGESTRIEQDEDQGQMHRHDHHHGGEMIGTILFILMALLSCVCKIAICGFCGLGCYFTQNYNFFQRKLHKLEKYKKKYRKLQEKLDRSSSDEKRKSKKSKKAKQMSECTCGVIKERLESSRRRSRSNSQSDDKKSKGRRWEKRTVTTMQPKAEDMRVYNNERLIHNNEVEEQQMPMQPSY